jgi:hypothetical protein
MTSGPADHFDQLVFMVQTELKPIDELDSDLLGFRVLISILCSSHHLRPCISITDAKTLSRKQTLPYRCGRPV